jgi:hypothetical protein
MDYPREEIKRKAEEAIMLHGGPDCAMVFFKFTCGLCDTRCALVDPNTLWTEGECYFCGHKTKIDKAGFMLMMKGGEKDGDSRDI